jgi:hypothetical protein
MKRPVFFTAWRMLLQIGKPIQFHYEISLITNRIMPTFI